MCNCVTHPIYAVIGLELIRDLTHGTLEGGTIGSTEITLTPGQINGGDYAVDTKTAGYISQFSLM